MHLAGELYRQDAKIDIMHVPYKGSAPAITGLVGGQVDLMFDSPSTALPQVQNGHVRAIAVTSAQQMPALLDVPALAERYPSYLAIVWYAVVAPRGLPPEARARLKAAIDEALQAPNLRQAAEKSWIMPGSPMTPQKIAEHYETERNRWSELIHKQEIRLSPAR